MIPYVRFTTPGSKVPGLVGVALPVWVNVTPKAASTIKESLLPRVLPGSVLVVAAGVAVLAKSTAVTVGWVVPAAWVMALAAEHVSVGLAGVQAMGVGKLALVNVYPPEAPKPPAAV
jgi:hypothetical protein